MRSIAVLCILGIFFAVSHAADTPSRPNILLIVIDDLNDYVGYLEGPRRRRLLILIGWRPVGWRSRMLIVTHRSVTPAGHRCGQGCIL